jgi:glycosyltransferase involved in cell wall biosynthesis
MQNKVIFIAWSAYSRRSQLIAEQLGIPLFLIHALRRRYFLAPLRYLLQAIRTLLLLVRERPAMTFVQNPPILLALLVYLYTRLLGGAYVIDSHTGALLAPWWRWSLPLHAFLSRRARATLVTNDHLAALVRRWGAPVYIVPDIPADFPAGSAFPVAAGFSVAVINTFSPDEPVAELLQAAAALPAVTFYITGDPIRANARDLRQAPPNVHFTGFLPDAQYIGLLRAVQGVVVLTTDNHTMQRGACEALWLGQPLLISDWPFLRRYFHKGAVYTANTSAEIQAGIQRLHEALPQLKADIGRLQQERRAAWTADYARLRELCDQSHLAQSVLGD